VAVPTPGGEPVVELIDFEDTAGPGAASDLEKQLVAELRADTGFAALIGENGDAALTTFDTITNDFAQDLIRDVAAAIDAGQIPTGEAGRAGQFAGIGPHPAIDVSVFAETGFTASTLMTLYSGIVQLASQSGTGTLPRTETINQVIDGLAHHVVLNTTFTVHTGEGRASADLILAATDNITNPTTGAFVALYTSRSVGHFDVNACPDDFGIAEGTYTFETKHELNDVSSPQAAQSAAGRSVEAPFQLINGEDAHLQRVDAQLDMQADGRGPGSPGGPGPTSPFDWGASQQADVSMPVRGSTTATGTGIVGTGIGSEQAAGSMFVSSAMAQLFLMEVGKQAEEYWRKGECIEIKTTEESKKVSKGETVEFEATAVGKFDGEDIDAPIQGEFSGKESLEPQGAPQDPPASFTFVAGEEEGDKGTIKLEQVGRRGIGKKTVEFTVGPSDFKLTALVPQFGGQTALKCDEIGGAWTINYQGVGQSGTTTFVLPEDGGSVPAHTDLRISGNSIHYVLDGTASASQDAEGDWILHLNLGSGTATVKAGDFSHSENVSYESVDYPLEQGDFCT
jgi:hypothetical protein